MKSVRYQNNSFLPNTIKCSTMSALPPWHAIVNAFSVYSEIP